METAHVDPTCRVQSARRNSQRGIALVTTLLLLMLFMAVTVSMVIAATSDTLITRYYRTFRSSFYAGDSGVNIARQYMANELVANANVAIGTTFAPSGTPPLSATDASTTVTDALNQYSSSYSSSNGLVSSGQGANSWPGKFYLVQTLTNTPGTTLSAPTCTPKFTPPNPPSSGTLTPALGPYDCGANYPTCTGACTGFAITDFDYTFPYTITAVGQSQGSERQVVEDEGNLVLDIHVAPSNGIVTNFAAWGMFIDKWTECSGGILVPGTITGPVFTNGAWTFGTTGQYIFTNQVGSVSSTFGYQFSGTCDSSAATSDKNGSTTIAPTFQGGTNLGANPVPLPTDSFNQKEAVVDGVGTSCAGSSTQCPSNAVMNVSLRDINGNPYPTAGASTGVFLGYSQTTSGGVTTRTMTGGGILVEGNASVVMTAGAGKTQVFTITQGGATTTVTVDITNNQTTIHSGSTTTTVTGVPDYYGGSSPAPSTMLYVDGSITSLSGPSGSGVAVQDGYGTTITAKNDIAITGDILYKTEPVTTTQNQIPNTPADTLIPGNNNGQVLGIFTAGGNVLLQVPTSGQNLEIDASIATIKNGGFGGIVNGGNQINTLTIVGGRVQNTIQNINSLSRNVYFDRRFAQGGFAPPWFPSTTVTPIGQDSVQSVTATAQRTLWYIPSF